MNSINKNKFTNMYIYTDNYYFYLGIKYSIINYSEFSRLKLHFCNDFIMPKGNDYTLSIFSDPTLKIDIKKYSDALLNILRGNTDKFFLGKVTERLTRKENELYDLFKMKLTDNEISIKTGMSLKSISHYRLIICKKLKKRNKIIFYNDFFSKTQFPLFVFTR